MQISVVIPAYNEESVIARTVHSVNKYLREHCTSYELLVVDDASTDRTAEIVASIPMVQLIQYKPNRGKGFAVRQGVLAAQGDLILFMDADNSTDIRELDHFIPEIEQHDIVVGSRAMTGSTIALQQPLLKRWLGRAGNRIIRLVLSLPFRDTQCGFKLLRRDVQKLFNHQRIERWGFDFEFLFLARRAGYRILESPVTWTNNFNTKVTALGYMSVLRDVCMVRLWSLLRRY